MASNFFSSPAGYGSMIQAGTQLTSTILDIQSQEAQQQIQKMLIEQQIQETRDRAVEEVDNVLEEIDKVVAKQAVQYAGSGVALSGSALEIMAQTVDQGAEAAQRVRQEYDYNIGNMSFEEAMLSDEMDNINSKYFMSLVGAGGQVAGDYANYDMLRTRK